MKTCLLFFVLVAAVASVADAQRLKDARTAFRPVAQFANSSTPYNPSPRVSRAAQRVVYGGAIGIAVGLSIAYFAASGESGELLAVAGLGYLVGTAFGAASVESETCADDQLLLRALGGAFLGGIVGGGIAGAINGRKDLPAVLTAVFGLFGAPVGAAWALWTCD